MARKDVPTILVLKAYEEYQKHRNEFPYEILSKWTGEPEKVCYSAMERDRAKGYIECGVSLRTGWLTEEGKEFLSKYK
ncbi:hypothetical protein [Cytobacillus praedii]|uniref:hypothetical protein n=1 Tax=Cytobacillus praedii TaxID=1742358 RepID=UPI00070A8B23|nr:hypothetical protein [Cytobacillus praedii]